MTMLPLLLMLVPIVAALAISFRPASASLGIAKLSSLVGVALAGWLAWSFDWATPASMQFAGSVPVAPDVGVALSYGIDSVALWLILLTAFLQPLCVWGSATAITERKRTYYAWLTVLQAAMVGVFMARDLVFFYVCFEFTLVPMYVLISLYGSTNRRYAATKFFLYTFTGSIIALAGLVYVAMIAARTGGEWTFDLAALEAAARSMSPREQGWVLLALMCGFAVKVPLFPVHTWLPLAHTEAPTAGSVILAGVLLKLGTYAIWRFVLPFVPIAVVEYAPLIATICIVGILYGGLICWVQRDVKKLVAYSSVAHLGFCMLGMFALNDVGAMGSILYMINHGLSTGALFFCIGFMYERYHTRSLDEVGGLATRMPCWAFFMVFFAMASVGLPGLNGFVSEFLCLMGAFQSGASNVGLGGTLGPLGPWYAAIAGLGMIVAAMYLLLMVGKIVWGPLREPAGHASHAHGHDHAHSGAHSGAHGADHKHAGGHDAHAGHLPPDLTRREIMVLAPLALACVVLGVLPTPMMKTLEPPIRQTLSIIETAVPGLRAEPKTPATASAETAPALGSAEVTQ